MAKLMQPLSGSLLQTREYWSQQRIYILSPPVRPSPELSSVVLQTLQLQCYQVLCKEGLAL